MTIFLVVLLVLVVIYVSQGIKIVSQSETVIIERLGKYNRTLQAGINIILPIVEKPKATAVRMPNGFIGMTRRIDLREQAHVFVEMEARHLRPVDSLFLDESLEELELACASGDDNASLALFGDSLADLFGGGVCGLLRHIEFVFPDCNLHFIIPFD